MWPGLEQAGERLPQIAAWRYFQHSRERPDVACREHRAPGLQPQTGSVVGRGIQRVASADTGSATWSSAVASVLRGPEAHGEDLDCTHTAGLLTKGFATRLLLTGGHWVPSAGHCLSLPAALRCWRDPPSP